jgi:asparagine synthase (glutamine-hydrolysing)
MRYGVDTGAGEDRLSRELESVVEEAVATHCRPESFARTGAYLSGGTDSSTVVGMMARRGQGTAKAFSIGFEEERFNELGYAEIAAAKFHADHYTYHVGPRECFEALPEMVRHFDEPFANSSAIPTYFCGRLAAQNGVRVLLAGDGGDELFGGNERYRTDKIFQVYQNVPRLLRKGAIEPVLRALPFRSGPFAMARSYTRRSNLPAVERYFSYNFLCAHDNGELLDAGFRDALGGYSVLDIPSRYYAEAPARDHLDRILYVDVKITLGDSDLPKVTCMSELAGIETRFPYLDRKVAEFSGQIPPRLKVKALEKRYLFKKAFRNLLPVEILRKQKHGFGIPVATWLKSDRRMRELTHETILSSRALQRGYFRRKFLEDLFARHEADDSTYYGDTLWTFLILEMWHLQYVDQRVGAAV